MFSDIIIEWYQSNKRDLPWRNTRDPYKIWLSEIILQQTRVNQGMEYYNRFVAAFPTISDLAEAKEDFVLKLWQGLGYYSRARNLHATACIVRDKFKGKFPNKYVDILGLKGIGQYTAAAIVSFCFNQTYPVVDGNVYRVLARVFGMKTPIDSAKGKKDFYKLANSLIDKKRPGTYNQAIMEFGATQCKPQNPNCTACPLNTMCFAYDKKKVDKLPFKSKAAKQRNRYFYYLVIRRGNKLVLHKRTQKDIWRNLYDFPLIEANKLLDTQELIKTKEWRRLLEKQKFILKSISPTYKHILSHQLIYAVFFEIELKNAISKKLQDTYLVIKKENLEHFAIPRLIDKYLAGNHLGKL